MLERLCDFGFDRLGMSRPSDEGVGGYGTSGRVCGVEDSGVSRTFVGELENVLVDIKGGADTSDGLPCENTFAKT